MKNFIKKIISFMYIGISNMFIFIYCIIMMDKYSASNTNNPYISFLFLIIMLVLFLFNNIIVWYFLRIKKCPYCDGAGRPTGVEGRKYYQLKCNKCGETFFVNNITNEYEQKDMK